MFTGLIEKTSLIEKIQLNDLGAKISFCADFDDVKIGDSIAVNGACLTITSIENNIFHADIMNESLKNTNLKNLKKGDIVNLERAMKLDERLQGHIVSGHVDCTAVVKSVNTEGFSKKVRFNCNSDLIIKKGSIAINGISLTVVNVYDDGFETCLIPETIKNTNLKNIKVGDIVNIEYDLFAKYIQKFNSKKESKITLEFLKENGF